MSKLSSKISLPVILAGVFAVSVFIAVDSEKLEPEFLGVLMLLTVFIFFFGFATGQEFTAPVKKILEKATELSKGNYSSRVYLETKDELADLARVFNKIAEELEDSQMGQENSEKSVSIKVKARTKELEETINALEQKVRNRTLELQKNMEEAQKYQQQLKTREDEAAELKKQITQLKTDIEKKSVGKKIKRSILSKVL